MYIYVHPAYGVYVSTVPFSVHVTMYVRAIFVQMTSRALSEDHPKNRYFIEV